MDSLWGPDAGGRMAALPYPNLILFTPLNPEAENPYGVSLLRSLPFLADILTGSIAGDLWMIKSKEGYFVQWPHFIYSFNNF